MASLDRQNNGSPLTMLMWLHLQSNVFKGLSLQWVGIILMTILLFRLHSSPLFGMQIMKIKQGKVTLRSQSTQRNAIICWRSQHTPEFSAFSSTRKLYFSKVHVFDNCTVNCLKVHSKTFRLLCFFLSFLRRFDQIGKGIIAYENAWIKSHITEKPFIDH